MTAVLHLARDVLDHEIVDADGVPCGTVDDIEFDGDAGGALRVVALLTGPGAMHASLPRPLAHLARRLFGARRIRVPWSEVASVRERVALRVPAKALRLDAADRRLGRLLQRLPGA